MCEVVEQVLQFIGKICLVIKKSVYRSPLRDRTTAEIIIIWYTWLTQTKSSITLPVVYACVSLGFIAMRKARVITARIKKINR